MCKNTSGFRRYIPLQEFNMTKRHKVWIIRPLKIPGHLYTGSSWCFTCSAFFFTHNFFSLSVEIRQNRARSNIWNLYPVAMFCFFNNWLYVTSPILYPCLFLPCQPRNHGACTNSSCCRSYNSSLIALLQVTSRIIKASKSLEKKKRGVSAVFGVLPFGVMGQNKKETMES